MTDPRPEDTAEDYPRYKERYPGLTMMQFLAAKDEANDPNGRKFRDSGARFVRISPLTRLERFTRWLHRS